MRVEARSLCFGVYSGTVFPNPSMPRPAPPAYAELHCHSAFSLLDGASLPEALVERAHTLGYPALAITDHDELGGIVRFAQAAAAVGVGGILGVELTVEVDDARLTPLARRPEPAVVRATRTAESGGTAPTPLRRTHLVLLAESREGYGNISQLVTRARMDRTRGEPAVSFDLLAQHTAGVFALTGCPRGWVPQLAREGKLRDARRALGLLSDLFPDRLAVEVWNHGLPEERKLVRRLLPIAQALGVPWVVTNNVHYAEPAARIVHDVLTALRHERTLDDMGTLLRPNAEWYLKSAQQLATTWQGYEEGLTQSLAIAERCAFRLEQLRPALPSFPLPPGVTADAYLTQLIEQGATERWGPPGTSRRSAKHETQLAHELALIAKLQLAGFFLIVWDIVRFARREGILCQGRGSAANSAVCYCLGITAVDPIRMELLFERFLSEERQEPPDIDIDFAHRDRERVLQYVYERYGREHAAMVCEQITYRGRSAVRDVARVLGFSVQQGDALAGLADRFSAKATADSLRVTAADASTRDDQTAAHTSTPDAAAAVRTAAVRTPALDAQTAAHRLAPDPRLATEGTTSQHAPDTRDVERDLARAALRVDTWHWRDDTPEHRAATPNADGIKPHQRRDAAKRALRVAESSASQRAASGPAASGPAASGPAASGPPESGPPASGPPASGPPERANPFAPDLASRAGPAGGPSARDVLVQRLGQRFVGGTEAVRLANVVDDEARKVRPVATTTSTTASSTTNTPGSTTARSTVPATPTNESPDTASANSTGNALLESVGLDPDDVRVQRARRCRRGLHQLPRHRSIHVGGFILTEEPLGTVVPIEPASMPGRTVIQWEKDDLDPVGLVKIDLLGLGMLTVVQDCLLYIRHTRGVDHRSRAARHDRPGRVRRALCAADTVGVFQVESRAQMNTLPRLKPRCFYDLVVEVALIRPGPIQGEMVHPYLRRRAGLEPVTYPHPVARSTCSSARSAFRSFRSRACRWRSRRRVSRPGRPMCCDARWGTSARANAWRQSAKNSSPAWRRTAFPRRSARRIYNQINAFADYGFPESHAASFALIVYATAYLRHYYAPGIRGGDPQCAADGVLFTGHAGGGCQASWCGGARHRPHALVVGSHARDSRMGECSCRTTARAVGRARCAGAVKGNRPRGGAAGRAARDAGSARKARRALEARTCTTGRSPVWRTPCVV